MDYIDFFLVSFTAGLVVGLCMPFVDLKGRLILGAVHAYFLMLKRRGK